MKPVGIVGAWVFTPRIHYDHRGSLHEWFQSAEVVEQLGYRFEVSQVNCSISHRGVIRGIHFTEVPPGQAKYIGCVSGAIMDVVVDLRVGSPTYGQWEAVTLDDENRRAVFISEGLGHAFMALSGSATVFYLCSTPYAPAIEHSVNAFDAEIGIAWPDDVPAILSEKDTAAPTLAEVARAGLLPSRIGCQAHAAQLRHAIHDGHGNI